MYYETILNKTRNVLNIPEFKPIVEMCKNWLNNVRDESKYNKSNTEVLENFMNCDWVSLGYLEQFTCRWVAKYDYMENNEKAQCWKECLSNYLKSKYCE